MTASGRRRFLADPTCARCVAQENVNDRRRLLWHLIVQPVTRTAAHASAPDAPVPGGTQAAGRSSPMRYPVLRADMANALAKTFRASGVRAESALLSRLSCYARLVVGEV